jgi:hypothetical protein
MYVLVQLQTHRRTPAVYQRHTHAEFKALQQDLCKVASLFVNYCASNTSLGSPQPRGSPESPTTVGARSALRRHLRSARDAEVALTTLLPPLDAAVVDDGGGSGGGGGGGGGGGSCCGGGGGGGSGGGAVAYEAAASTVLRGCVELAAACAEYGGLLPGAGDGGGGGGGASAAGGGGGGGGGVGSGGGGGGVGGGGGSSATVLRKMHRAHVASVTSALGRFFGATAAGLDGETTRVVRRIHSYDRRPWSRSCGCVCNTGCLLLEAAGVLLAADNEWNHCRQWATMT